MSKIIGFIGCGNMAQAMIGGIVKSKLMSGENIMASARSDKSLSLAKNQFGIKVTKDNKEVAKNSNILFLAVKPNMYSAVIDEVKEYVNSDCIVITIAAGKTIAGVEKDFGKKVKLVRTMPNTPALVGEGMSAICPNQEVSKEELDEVIAIFNSFGKVESIEERLIDAFITVSGSSPAYIFMFIEAMADGAVLQGMPRDKAYKMAAQAVLGSAKMVLETGMHPGELKDMVCSPGGTTIEAVAELEEKGMRTAVISAMKRCADKARDMAK